MSALRNANVKRLSERSFDVLVVGGGINGAVSDHYSGACFGCHTVGNDPGVAGGFDDAAAAAGWSMPVMGGTNWDNGVKPDGNIMGN